MTLSEVTEIMIRAANGGNYTSDQKWDILYIESLVHKVREDAIIIAYNGSRTRAANKTISADWVQKQHYTNFTKVNPTLEASYLTTTALPVVRINSKQTGVVYQGTQGASVQFYEAETKGQINTWVRQGFFDTGKRVAVLRTGTDLEVYGNILLTDLYEEAVYQRPDLVTGFNYDTSLYPVNEGLISIMKELFIQQVRPELMIAKDTVADRNHNPVIQP